MSDKYKDDVERFLGYFSHRDEEKAKEISDFYWKLLLSVKVELYNTHIALAQCKTFEQIAKEFTKREQKKKPLTRDAIRKRAAKVLTIIKDAISNKYGKK